MVVRRGKIREKVNIQKVQYMKQKGAHQQGFVRVYSRFDLAKLVHELVVDDLEMTTDVRMQDTTREGE